MLDCFDKCSKGRNGKTRKEQDKVTQTDQSPHQLAGPIGQALGTYYANQPPPSYDGDTEQATLQAIDSRYHQLQARQPSSSTLLILAIK